MMSSEQTTWSLFRLMYLDFAPQNIINISCMTCLFIVNSKTVRDNMLLRVGWGQGEKRGVLKREGAYFSLAPKLV